MEDYFDLTRGTYTIGSWQRIDDTKNDVTKETTCNIKPISIESQQPTNHRENQQNQADILIWRTLVPRQNCLYLHQEAARRKLRRVAGLQDGKMGKFARHHGQRFYGRVPQSTGSEEAAKYKIINVAIAPLALAIN